MSVRPAGADSGDETGGRAVPRVIASAPWVVVLLGTALLVVLLVVAVLSFRGPERPAQSAPAPPMSLPIPAAADTPAPAQSPSRAAPAPSTSSAQPTAPSRTAAAAASSATGPGPASIAPTSIAPTDAPMVADTGGVTASYRVLNTDVGSFRARLSVHNGTGERKDWQVELRFTGEVTGVQASSGPGVSVTIRGSGWYLLSGTRPLDAGGQQTVQLRFSRTGGGEHPAQCTVNGSACAD